MVFLVLSLAEQMRQSCPVDQCRAETESSYFSLIQVGKVLVHHVLLDNDLIEMEKLTV